MVDKSCSIKPVEQQRYQTKGFKVKRKQTIRNERLPKPAAPKTKKMATKNDVFKFKQQQFLTRRYALISADVCSFHVIFENILTLIKAI